MKIDVIGPILNKTGLQHVSRPVEQIHYFEGWVEGANPFVQRPCRQTGVVVPDA